MLDKEVVLAEGVVVAASTGDKVPMDLNELLEQTGTDKDGEAIVMGVPEVDRIPVANVRGVETSIAKVMRTKKPVIVSK